VGGGITVLIWKQLEGGIFDLYEIVPGFLISILLIVATSLLGPKPDPAVESEFKSATQATT
jgi:sodium/proline symporter